MKGTDKNMAERYQTIYEGGEGEIVEKKSRFIATVEPVESEEEALAFIERMKKKYWDARHNCSAFVIGERGQIQRCSDDGEPQGTAGRPMLDVLLGQEIRNVAVVVTRYFGGVLLGTGGLVRAYSGAVQAGLAGSVVIEKIPGTLLDVRTDYNGLGKIQYILGQRGLQIQDSIYTDQVEVQVLVPQEDLSAVMAEITDKTNGQAVMEPLRECMFAKVGTEMKIFDE
jgi:uncharacterized YigZ family protein